VSFPSGAQAEDKPQSAGREIRLVGMRNDGWIEQGRGLQGVFGQKIGADQEASLFGQLLIRPNRFADLLEAFQEQIPDSMVPLGELGRYFIEQRGDAVFRDRHNPGHDADTPLGIPFVEGP
jgi:hypothetical protein